MLCNRTIRDKIVRMFREARSSGKLNFEIGDEGMRNLNPVTRLRTIS